ncbi:MAG: hypothetical protein IJ871_02110 [Ruminococcus sp.]|nr:hypothetical protein [Ruminococcus sp.]
MPKLKKRKSKDYTIISNTILRDKSLGGMERGLFLTMWSLPDHWDFSIKGLCAILPDGYTKVSNSLKKLESAGYLVRNRVFSNGKISDWEYIIDDEPMTDANNEESDSKDQSGSQESGFQIVENQELENQIIDNQELDNQVLENRSDNKIKNNKKQNNQVSNNQTSINLSADTDRYMQDMQQYTGIVKTNIEYNNYAQWAEESDGYMTVAELDDIVQMIVRTICSKTKTEVICGQSFPREVVKAAMLKVDRICLENAIEQIKQTDNIKNYEKYLISTLFNEANGKDFKENAETRWAKYAVGRDLSDDTATWR